MSLHLAHVLEAKWRSDDVNTNEGRDFSSFRLDERILAGLSNAGYRIPSPVQLQGIPLCLTGKDVFVQGKAGTGKTLVFSILALTQVLEAEDLKVLIVAPTREGAFQIYNTICAIGSEVDDLKCECFIGGFSYSDDIPKASGCKIAVGTPGRILHLMEGEKLIRDTIRLFIIDDFDELLNKHMKPEVNEISCILPENIQTVVTTLTCTEEVMELASEFLKPPFLTCCNENELSLLGMAHYYYIVPLNFLPLLSYRRKLEVLKNVFNKVKFSQCVVFCNSLHRVEPLRIDIKSMGFSTTSISKAKDQVDRLKAVELMKKNKCRVLVSTDLSSRGLDAENIDLVINFDMPKDCRGYLQRCGRAGRYGAKCSSITFLLKNQTELFNVIENEGRFNSYALPDPIPEDLNCDSNPCAEPCLPILSTGCDSKKNFLASSTAYNKNAIVNIGNTTAAEDCLIVLADKKGETGLEHVDSSHSVLISNKIEKHTAADLETVDTTTTPTFDDLLRDFRMPKLINDSTEDNQDTAKIKGSEDCLPPSYEENAEFPESSNEHYKNSIAVSSECKSLPHNDSLESSIISSDVETPETELRIEKTDYSNEYSSSEDTELYSVSQTEPKRFLTTKAHKALDKMHLESEKRCFKKVTKIPQVTQKKEKSSKGIRNICIKKSVKSPNQCKGQSKSGKGMFSGLKASSSKFDADQTCPKSYSRYPANHVGKKKVYKNHNQHSTCEKTRKACGPPSPAPYPNGQGIPMPCHPPSPRFPNNYVQPPFLMDRDIFYQQLMFINHFSNFVSHYLLK